MLLFSPVTAGIIYIAVLCLIGGYRDSSALKYSGSFVHNDGSQKI